MVEDTKCPKLDTVMKQNLSKDVKDSDVNVAKLQTLMPDGVAPLVHIWEEAQRGTLTSKTATEAACAALALLENPLAHMTCDRRKRILRDLNKDLLPLAEDEEAFKGAAPLLFGDSFKRKMKDHLESQLGKANPRSLGTRGCTGSQGAFHPPSLPRTASKASKTLRGRGESLAGGDSEHVNEKCHRRDHTQRGWFSVHSVPGTKERWGSETSNQPEKSEQVCSYRTLQDGGHHVLKDLLRAGDWMTKVDPKNAYFMSPGSWLGNML